MSESWPQNGTGWDTFLLFQWNLKISRQAEGPIQSWTLSMETVGKECLSWEWINYTWAGEIKCRRALIYNDTSKSLLWWTGAPIWHWAPPKGGNGNHTCIPFNSTSRILVQNCTGNQPDINPFLAIPGISPYWNHLNSTNPDLRQAPEGLFWICGRKTYPWLPSRWERTCTIAVIQPGFFLLSDSQGDTLGIPIYNNLRHREKWSLKLRGKQNWGKDECPLQQIIQYYGLATWAQDGSWVHRIAINMLNWIIQLQAVLENITNETGTVVMAKIPDEDCHLSKSVSTRLPPSRRRRSLWEIQPNWLLYPNRW